MSNGKEKDIGALWVRKGKNGQEFIGGYIEVSGQKLEIICFTNKYKKEAKHPDYKVYLSVRREQQAQHTEPEDNLARHEAQDKALDEALSGGGEKPAQQATDDYGLGGVVF